MGRPSPSVSCSIAPPVLFDEVSTGRCHLGVGNKKGERRGILSSPLSGKLIPPSSPTVPLCFGIACDLAFALSELLPAQVSLDIRQETTCANT